MSSGVPRNRQQKDQAADTFGAEGQFLSAHKKLLDTKHPAYPAIANVRNQILCLWRAMTLPYPEPGVRLIRQDHIDTFNTQMSSARERARHDSEHRYTARLVARRQCALATASVSRPGKASQVVRKGVAMGLFVDWLATSALGKAAEKGIEKLRGTQLERRLREVAEKWRRELPSEAELITVQVFLTGSVPGVSAEEPPPRRVFKKLERSQIPSVDDWTELFLWHWNLIRTVQEDLVPFFKLDRAAAEDHLRRLAEAVVRECENDPELFQGEVLKQTGLLLRGQDEIKASLARGCKSHFA